MYRFIKKLIFLILLLILAGYFLGVTPANYTVKLPAIYENIKNEALRLYEEGSTAIGSLIKSGKLRDTVETTSKDVKGFLEGLKDIPLNKNSVKTQTISGMPEHKYTVNNYEEYYEVIYKSLYNFEDSVTIKLNNYDQDTYNLDVVNQVIYDNFDIDYGITSIGATLYSGLTYKAITIKFDYAFDRNTMIKMRSASEAAAKEIIQGLIKPGMSDLEKELAIHDYIVKTTEYDYDNLVKNTLPEEVYTIYGVLINRKAVCEGYAKAIFKLLTMAGVENKVVIGTADGTPHAWNLVKIDGSYTHLDATWDDPVTNTGKGILRHKYFNISDEQISKDHKWDTSKYPRGVSIPLK